MRTQSQHSADRFVAMAGDKLAGFAVGAMCVSLRGMIGPGLPGVQHRRAKAYFDVALRTGTRELHCGLDRGADGMRSVGDMLALDVSPLAQRDLRIGRCEIEWPR